MSEMFGGHDENQNEDEFDLDQEWAELSKSLTKTPEEEMAIMGRQAEYDAAKDYVMEHLYESGIPHVVDPNVQKEYELYRDYTIAYYERKLDEYAWSGREPDEAFERAITIQCIYDYFDQRELEVLVVNMATALLYMQNNSAKSEGLDVLAGVLKKQLQAELLVHFGRPMDDRWQVFFDETVPGESLDTMREGDLAYIYIANDSFYQFKHEHLKKLQIVGEAKSIIGLNDDEDDLGRVVEVTADLLNMQTIAAEKIHNESERANRNAELWRESRRLSPDETIVRRVVELFDNEYPISCSGT